MDNNFGRPSLTQENIEDIFRKLEPRLRTGGSLYSACIAEGIPKSTAYDLYNENEQFAEKIDAARHYRQIMADDILTKVLQNISEKVGTSVLTQDELKFVQWISERRVAVFDFMPLRTKMEKNLKWMEIKQIT